MSGERRGAHFGALEKSEDFERDLVIYKRLVSAKSAKVKDGLLNRLCIVARDRAF
jgi:hypothetical protein